MTDSSGFQAGEIAEPGVYRGMPAAIYHADPCPAPSLSASIARVLINQSPRHAWTAHPRLNPHYDGGESTSKMDFGTVAHQLLLGQGRGIVVVDADNWRGGAAQKARAEAIDEGRVAVLRKDFYRADEMVASARVQLAAIPDCHDAFSDADLSEQAVIWREGATWFRNLADYIASTRETGHVVCYDYKTTSASAAPHAVARHLYSMEYEVQAAMLERGLHNLGLAEAGRVVFRFVVQEAEPPFALTVAEMDSSGWMIGRKKVAAAAELWRRCLKRNEWPCYLPGILRAEMPAFMEASWLAREENPADMASLEGDEWLAASAWMPKTASAPLVGGS